MKKHIVITLLIALVAMSCGQPEKSVADNEARWKEANEKLKALQTEIASLEKEIGKKDPTFNKSVEAATIVTTVSAETTHFEHKIEVRGNVESRTNVNISAEMMGRLTTLNIKEGQYVRKGRILATINADNLEKTIDEVKLQLDFATTVFEKRDRLWKKNIGTEIDYLQAKNTKESLEKQLATLKTQLAKAKIKAPFNGTVDRVAVRQGEVVQPGQPVALLVSNSDIYIAAEVSEAYVDRFRKGDRVNVTIPALGKVFDTELLSIGRVINPTNRTFKIEVRLPQVAPSLKTNLITRIKLTDYTAENAIIIPSRVIQEDLRGNFVYCVNDKKVEKVHVKPGYSYDNYTEVISGLKGGETIVDKGSRTVTEGSIVSIQ